MNKPSFFFVLFVLLLPNLILADGGMIWWPRPIVLNQSAQNAIVAWNGQTELMTLSVDIESSATSTVLRVIPLPANPSEIKEGDFKSFETLANFINDKLGAYLHPNALGLELEAGKQALPGIEITFHEKIGAHDITVVKVNDLDYFFNWIGDFASKNGLEMSEEVNCDDYDYSDCPSGCIADSCWMPPCPSGQACIQVCQQICRGNKVTANRISQKFKEGVSSYLKRGIDYFVFDVIDASGQKESIKPIIYKFQSDCLYFPILISGVSDISQSQAKIELFLITNSDIVPFANWISHQGDAVQLSHNELKEVSEDIAGLFQDSAYAREVYGYGRLNDFTNDLMSFAPDYWQDNLALGSRGNKVQTLQKLLINEGFWQSEVGATGYFGPITKAAVMRYQEKYASQILAPLKLTTGTGFVGAYTRDHLENRNH